MTESVKQVLYGTYLFSNNQNVTSVNLNNATFTNGSMAYCFNNCNSLTYVSGISNNVTNMAYVFNGCHVMTSTPSIPDSVINMNHTFSYCWNITVAPTLPSGVRDLNTCFLGCGNISTPPVIPNSVTSLDSTFHTCSKFTTTPEIPNSVTSLSSTFSNCYSLTSIRTIANSVTSMSSTFAFCNKLTSIPTLPNSVKTMYGTFRNCISLTSMPTLPENVTSIAWCFEGDKFTSIGPIPSSVTNMYRTFNNCQNLTGSYVLPEQLNCALYQTYSNCWRMSGSVTIPSGVTGCPYTFNCCNQLTSATINTNYCTNMYYTFNKCSSLTDINFIGNHVSGWYYAFNNCTSLTNAFFNANVIGPGMYTNTIYCGLFNARTSLRKVSGTVNTFNCGYAFNGCTGLTSFDLVVNNQIVGTGIFNGCTGLTSLDINPANEISSTRFANNCTSITDLNVTTETITTLSYGFYNCVSLVNAKIEANHCENTAHMFDNCYSLSNLSLNINSCNVASGMFYNCNNLPTFPALPEGTTAIDYCYYNMKASVPPIIPSTVTTIAGMFSNCTNLLGSGDLSNCQNVSYAYLAYSNCGLITDAPDLTNCSHITQAYGMFSGCTSLRNVQYLPESLTTIYNMFTNCSSLQTVPGFGNSVVNAMSTFDGCTSLTGDIYINSSNVADVTNCFMNTSLIKNVYIPYTYNNGTNSITFNSFINAGYDEIGTTNGVYLKPYFMRLNMSIPSDSELYLISGDSVTNSQQLTLKEDTSYVLYKQGYVPYTKHITYSQGSTTDSITDADLSTNGVTLTINTTPAEAIVELKYFGRTFESKTCKVESGTEIEYEIKCVHYKTVKNSITLTEDTTLNIEMEESTIPTEFGERIGGVATVIGVYTDYAGKEYVYALLDSNYRIEDYSSHGYIYSVPTNIRMYSNTTQILQNGVTPSAAEVTDLMVNFYEGTEYTYNPFSTIRYYQQHCTPVVIDGKTYNLQLPNVYELSNILNNYSTLDSLDPTLISGSPWYSLTNILSSSYYYIWSSVVHTSSIAMNELRLFEYRTNSGATPTLGSAYFGSGGYENFYVPIIEIPLDD